MDRGAGQDVASGFAAGIPEEAWRLLTAAVSEVRDDPEPRPPVRDQVWKDRALFRAITGGRVRSTACLSPSITGAGGKVPARARPSCVFHPREYDQLSVAEFVR